MRFRISAVLLLAVVSTATSCYCDDHDDCHTIVIPPPHLVGLTVEVRDGATGLLLEGARVELVSVAHEWSGTVRTSPFTVEGFTNMQGRVRISSQDLGGAEIGFREDGLGNAVLFADPDEDECLVTLDIDGAQFGSAQVVIQLSWDVPDKLVVIEI